MKTRLLYLFILLSIISSCSTTNDVPEPQHSYNLQRKLSEITFPSGGGITIDLTYTYNELGQLTRVAGVTLRDTTTTINNTIFQYDNQGRLTYAQDVYGTTHTSAYNDKGQLIKSVKQFKGKEPYIHLYTYSIAGFLQKAFTYRGEIGAENFVGTRTFTPRTNNSFIISAILASGEKSSEYILQTDNQKRAHPVLPYQSVHDFFASELFGETLFTTNNIIQSETVYQVNNTSGHDYQSQYTYNAAGYPLSCIKIFKGGSIERITYVYNH